MGDSCGEHLRIVEQLLGRSVSPDRIQRYAGQQNELLIVEGFVFRFPRVESARREALREVGILHALGPRLPVAIPQPSHVALDRPCPHAVMVYPLLRGKRLSADGLARLAPAARQRIAAQMGAFLQALRAVDPRELPIEPTVHETPADLHALHDRCRALLWPRVGQAARMRIEALLAALLRAEPYQPALRHGDLGASNILFDPQTAQLTGVLDWGGLALGDPALDLASLTCPASLGRGFLDLLGGPAQWGAEWQRAQLYMGLFALEEALWGAENDDAVALERGLQGM